jgi:hypothetical protein
MGLGSGIRDLEKAYSGSRIQGSKSSGSRIRIRNTAKYEFTLALGVPFPGQAPSTNTQSY